MRQHLLVLVFCIIAHTALGDQIQVDVNIIPSASNPDGKVNTTTLTQIAASQGATGFVGVIQQTVDTQLQAEQCPTGTFSSINTVNGIVTQTCTPCAAGTASSVRGASDSSTCIPCSTGSFSLTQASVCIDCAANTFSVTPAAPSPSSCLQCPPSTTSPSHSSAVEMCVCDAGYFISDNVLNTFPYNAIPITVPFIGASSINLAHVTC